MPTLASNGTAPQILDNGETAGTAWCSSAIEKRHSRLCMAFAPFPLRKVLHMGCKLKITIKGLALEARNRAVRSVGFWIAYGSMGVLEKNFQKLWKILEFFWHGCCHDAVGGVFCDATNQELFKALAPNVATGQAPVWTAKSGRHGNIL